MRRALSDEYIATQSVELRKLLRIPEWMKIDIKSLILRLELHADPLRKIKFIEMPAGYFRGFSAKCRPRDRTVFFKAGLLDAAIAGNAEAIAVFLEEIAHCLLHREVKSIDHADGVDHRARLYFDFHEMETEAKKFVFYTFAPISEVFSETDYKQLMAKFGMPEGLAKDYILHLSATRKKFDLKGGDVSDNVVFLEERREKPLPHTVGQISKIPPKEFLASANANSATATHNPSAGFIDEACDDCGNKTMRILGGCKQCLCGSDNGCT